MAGFWSVWFRDTGDFGVCLANCQLLIASCFPRHTSSSRILRYLSTQQWPTERQELQAFPGFPADAALGRTKQFPEPTALWTQRWPADWQGIIKTNYRRNARRSQQKSLSKTTRNSTSEPRDNNGRALMISTSKRCRPVSSCMHSI
jgi:hypothetical protein